MKTSIKRLAHISGSGGDRTQVGYIGHVWRLTFRAYFNLIYRRKLKSLKTKNRSKLSRCGLLRPPTLWVCVWVMDIGIWPYSYPRHWTETSLQWRLIRDNIIKRLLSFKKTPRISLSCKLVPVEYREYEYCLIDWHVLCGYYRFALTLSFVLTSSFLQKLSFCVNSFFCTLLVVIVVAPKLVSYSPEPRVYDLSARQKVLKQTSFWGGVKIFLEMATEYTKVHILYSWTGLP